MSGFIDPNQPTKDRIDRLEAVIAEALSQIDATAFSPEARAIVDDLLSANEERQERARRRVQRLMAEDPIEADR